MVKMSQRAPTDFSPREFFGRGSVLLAPIAHFVAGFSLVVNPVGLSSGLD
jgi:hypothetical protein